MGVKLTDLVPKKEISFEDLKDKVIAVDASNCLFQFLSSIRQPDGTPLMDSKGKITSHLQGLFSRTMNLVNQGIKICYVFDGKAPLLKIKTQEERGYRKQIAEEKFREAKELEDVAMMAKYAKQTSRLTKEMVEESKELISALGLPVIQAPSEAEAQAAFMCEQKDVWAVGSSDYDTLIFGAPRLVGNLTLSQRKKLPSGAVIKINPELIELKKVLDSLNISQDQLLVLAILVGTDYNPGGIKGIGPKNALRLVKEYKNFDKLFESVNADFNWKEIYATFKSMPIMKNYKMKWEDVNEDKVKEILVERHEFSEERITKTLHQELKKDIKMKEKGLGDWLK